MTHVDEGPRPAIGPLGRLGRFAYRRRGTVALLWLATLLATLGLAQVFAGDFAADYSAPRSESKQAQQLLRERFASQSAAVVAVVVQSDAGVQSARGDVAALMDEWRRSGLDPETATIATLDTAGRSVVIAGTTVIVSMLGLFAMGLSYMRGAALVAIVGVLVVLAASVTLFPALLGYLGRHVDRLRLPTGRRRAAATLSADGHAEPSRVWRRWSGLVERHRVVAVLAGVAVMLALAVPFLGVQFGFPDAGNNRTGSMTRQAYDAIADGFGVGANGPLLLAVDVPGTGGPAVLDGLRTAVAATPGVASVSPPELSPAGDTAVLTVVPATGPQDDATQDLVRRLRDTTIPATGAAVLVGGATATSIDSTADLAGRIPYLIAGVVLLSMLLLLAGFRSLAVAAKAAVMNLLSVAASFGVVALVHIEGRPERYLPAAERHDVVDAGLARLS